MTPEAQRIAIAEACGWVKVREHWEKDGESAYCNDSHCHQQLPDYLNDLNAMHEIENTLSTDRNAYALHLSGVVHDRSLIFATAPQRCEAFLRTIGKWKD